MREKKTITLELSGPRTQRQTVRITVDTPEGWPAGDRFRERVEAMACGGRLKPEGTRIEGVRVVEYVEECSSA